jgi:hypothetical protein
MERVKDLSNFAVREIVSLCTGRGVEQQAEPAVVVKKSAGELHVAMHSPPLDDDRLMPGALVRVRRGQGASVRSQVVIVDRSVTPMIVVVRMLTRERPESNQRMHQRVPTPTLETYITAFTGGRAKRFRVHVLDLSASGARVASPHPLAERDRLMIRLTLDDGGDPLELNAEVAWSGPSRSKWQLGLRFIDLDDRERDRISELVFRTEMRIRAAG